MKDKMFAALVAAVWLMILGGLARSLGWWA